MNGGMAMESPEAHNRAFTGITAQRRHRADTLSAQSLPHNPLVLI